MSEVTMEKIIALSKNRGFVFPGSEIYGGLSNTWDFGPLGVELKNNIKKVWWKKFVQEHALNVGLDSAILLNSEVWNASGHLGGFSDPLMDCKDCNERFRADTIIEDYCESINEKHVIDGWTNEEMEKFIEDREIKCPSCGKHNFTQIRQFNLMFKTHIGVTSGSQDAVYLRPETAQGIFINFNNVQRTTRKKIPFGIAQIGKSFRNEITPRNFIFRVREFEQMELEFFCKPGTDLDWYEYWKEFCMNWLLNLNVKRENLRFRDHEQEELSHYSKGTVDIEYKFPFDWKEVWGIADRTDYDLKQHMEHSKEDFNYFDTETNEKYVPYCVEPSLGCERVFLLLLCEAYDEEDLGDGETRTVLHFHPSVAPVKIAVLPLSKKLGEESLKIYNELSKYYVCDYDETQGIGKRYRRQDEIGTPYCVTFDFDSLEDKKVTIRERDTMEQVRIPIDELNDYFKDKLTF